MEFRVLGSFEVCAGGVEVTPSAPKLRGVLAFLVFRHNQVLPVGTLIDELWGEDPPRSALPTLQTYMYKLRKLLDVAGGGGVLVTKPTGYLAAIPPEGIDVWRFEQQAVEGRLALDGGDAPRASQILTQALSMWRGPVLADVTAGERLSAHLTRVEESRLGALELRLDADLRLGRHRSLVSELRELTLTHRLHEGFHAMLMVALHRSGRRIEALDTYQLFRRALVSELGVEPGPVLRDLHSALLSDDPSPAYLPGPAQATPGSRPRRPAPGLTPGPPQASTETRSPVPAPRPPAPAEATPAQLPRDISDFAGRGEITARLTRMLAHPPDADGTAAGVVVVTGMPGVGKSVLAVRAAHQARATFPDGQLYADLGRSHGQPAHPAAVLGNFLRAAGIPAHQQPPALAERGKLFRSWTAGRRMLILLDDAVSGSQVHPLLPAGPGCRVLVTSRRSMAGLAGVHLMELGPMDPAEGLQLLENIAGPHRLSQDPAAAQDILRPCGGLPLAIRAAATWLACAPAWPLAKIAARLANPATFLTEPGLCGTTILTSFESSYHWLPAPDQGTFRLLSLLGNRHFTAAQAANLLGTDHDTTETCLSRLTECHLLTMTHDNTTGQTRYHYHQLTHTYAQTRLTDTLTDTLTTTPTNPPERASPASSENWI
jgi:DNA-binding SARP family transcriptional activator/Mrp family chromosome partitioning ATPase